MVRRHLLAIFAGCYLVGLVTITTSPLFFDTITSTYLAIGPLIFEVFVSAYLAIHYVRLKGLIRLIALFIAFEGLVTIPAGFFAPSGLGQTSPSGNTGTPAGQFTNNSTIRWINDFTTVCVLQHGQNSASESTGFYGLGCGGTSSSLNSDCHGFGQLAVQAYSSGVYSRAVIQASVWFMDQPFFVG